MSRLPKTWLLVAVSSALACSSPSIQSADAHSADAQSPDGSKAQEWVLMTWNVEFLWDGVPPEDGDADFPWKGNRRAAEAHMKDVADRIREVDPDILNLVEVEDYPALERFRKKFLADRGYRSYLVDGNDTATGQDVGLLSRVRIESQGLDPRRGRSGSTRKGVSKHYTATARLGSEKIGIIGLHLLARPDRQNRIHPRQAQADAITRMARELAGQKRSVIVWGDFNDYDGDTPDRDGSRPITKVLRQIRAMDPRNPDDDLVNAASRMDRKDRYTVRLGGRNPRFTAVDHILLSPALADNIVEVNIPKGQAWRDASDHFPVVVKLRM